MARILVVDDNPEIRMLLVAVLQRQNHEVVEAASGESVPADVEETNPDVIILDLMMPGIDGWETLLRLKQSAKSKHIPVIISSATSDTENLKRARLLGAVDYVPKPWSSDDLIMRVQWAATLQNQAA